MRLLGKKRIIALGVIALVLFGGVVYTGLFLEFVKVPTGAMKNTILPGDRLVSSRLGGEIKRGDVVLYKYPRGPATRFIKRVIGLPGDSVWFDSKTNRVVVNGDALDEHRVFVEPQYNNDDNTELKTVRDEGGSLWMVFYYKPEESWAGGGPFSDHSFMKNGVADAFRVPIKGNPIPDDMKTERSCAVSMMRIMTGVLTMTNITCSVTIVITASTADSGARCLVD